MLRWLGLTCASIALGATPALAQEALPDSVDDSELADTATVLGGAGFAYGSSVRQAATRCRRAAHRFSRSARPGVFRCSGVPRPELDLPGASVVLRFCAGRLCEVDVLMPLSERNRGVSAWIGQFRRLRATMEAHYGPATHATAADPPCLRSNRALGRCVLRGGAHVSAQWLADDGGTVSLHLVRVRDAGPHLRVIYAAGDAT